MDTKLFNLMEDDLKKISNTVITYSAKKFLQLLKSIF